MSPTNLTRRQLVGSFLALLFGWLRPGKGPKAQTQAPPLGPAPAPSSTTTYTYDLNGDLIRVEQAEVRPTQTVCQHDARNRVVKWSDGRG